MSRANHAGLTFYAAIRAMVLGLVLVIAGAIMAPAFAQQGQQINPTARSLKEEDLLKALKDGDTVRGRITIPDRNAANLIQPEGQAWRDYRRDTLPRIGAIAVLGMLVALCLFYAFRGRIEIDGGPSSQRIERFNGFERFTHWLTASSFLILGFTGLNVTFGRSLLLPIIGPEGFTGLSVFAKYLHNYLGFAFMLGVALTFLIWVRDNIPGKVDVEWFKAGGGILKGSHHPPAKRCNGGQKVVFWTVVLGGALLSISGLHLLFPNLVGGGIIEIQTQSVIHGILAMIMIAIIIAHIYIGSVGMEGAFDAMGSGEVDLNWAKAHHSLWVEEELKAKGSKVVHPAGHVAPAE